MISKEESQISNIENILKKIATNYYAKRDASHGLDHVVKVAQNTKKICKSENIEDVNMIKIMLAAAFFHDSYDHKYVKEEDIPKVKEKIKKDLQNIDFQKKDIIQVFEIIDNISFSFEKKLRQQGKQINLGKTQYMRDIVSDADKLEAIGEIAIERMIDYSNNCMDCVVINEEFIQQHLTHCREHSKEKLLILVDQKYIRTKSGIKLAKAMEQKLHDILYNDELMKKKIIECSRKFQV